MENNNLTFNITEIAIIAGIIGVVIGGGVMAFLRIIESPFFMGCIIGFLFGMALTAAAGYSTGWRRCKASRKATGKRR